MLRLSILTILILLVSSVVETRAQNEKPECPKISVTGPQGIIQYRDLFSFTGEVQGIVPENVGYKWTVTGGKIVEGQGTLNLKVDADWKDGARVTATLELIGLPQSCPTSASDSGSATDCPQAVFIDEFGKLASVAIKKRLNNLFAELGKNPNSQGYIILYGTEKERIHANGWYSIASSSAASIGHASRSLEAVHIRTDRHIPNFTESRLVPIIQLPKSMSKLVILCALATAFVSAVIGQTETPSNCPTISVTGPAGVVQPGDVAMFTANVDEPQRFGPLQYKWTFTGGDVLKGQDTTEIQVRAKKTEPVQMYATVRVSGLPQDCPDTASEKVEFFGEPVPVLIDEFGKLASDAIMARVTKFFTVLQNNPNNQGYIILYGTEKEMNTSERLITKGIIFRNYDRARITIVRGGTHTSGRIYTKFYRIPPGAENPAP